jgi:hypothetical protein
LAAGYQATQAIHAALEFGIQYPDIYREWHQQSNYLGFLSVPNEEELTKLIDKAKMLEIECSIFKEPDIGYQITAIALAPGYKSKKLCSNLKLALRVL